MKALAYLSPALPAGFHFLTTLPPAWIIIGGGLLLPLLRFRVLQQCLLLLVALMALASIWITTSTPAGLEISFGTTFLRFHTVHPYTRLFATAFMLVYLVGILVTLPRRYLLERMAICFCAGGAIGILYSGDLISLTSYLQVMAASFIMFFCITNKHEGKTARYYGVMHLSGSSLLLTSIVGLPSLALEEFPHQMSLADTFATLDKGNIAPLFSLLILIALVLLGFLPSLFLWITDSYKTIPLTGKLFILIFPANVVIFILLTCFSGSDACLYGGVMLSAFGIILSICEHRTTPLIYYILISQTGLLLTGIGIGTMMTENGVAIQAVSMMFSLPLLFLTLAVINSHVPEHAYATKPYYRLWLIALLILGAFSTVSFLFSPGYSGRLLMMRSITIEHLESLNRWLVLTTVVLILGGSVKLLWRCANKIQSQKTIAAPSIMLITLFMLAALVVASGIFPEIIRWMLPYGG